MIEVTLTEKEMRWAAYEGANRQIENVLAGRKDAYGFDGDRFEAHILGCMGELAYAKAKSRYWSGAGLGYADGEDVGHIQIRTRPKHEYELFVREADPDNAWFVLVTGQPPTLRIRGYIKGADAKRQEWWRALPKRPDVFSFWVPTDALRTFDAGARREAA